MLGTRYFATANILVAVAYAQPTQIHATISNLMPVVDATVQEQGPFPMNLEVNGPHNFVWSSLCQQSVGENQASCFESPTFVSESVDQATLSCIGLNKSYAQGGFETTGQNVCGTVGIMREDMTEVVTDQSIYLVGTISEDAWNYGSAVGSGAVSLAALANTTMSLAQDQVSGWSLETGPIVDQSFAGGSVPRGNVNLYIGGGDYSAIYPATLSDIKISADSRGSYTMESLGFGKLEFVAGTPALGFFEAIGFSEQIQSALIAPNFKGLGLPSTYWYQVVNLLVYGDFLTNQYDANCTPQNGGLCTIQGGTCADFSTLWDFSFKIQWQGASNYMNVPLGAFAADNSNGGCDIFLQYLDEQKLSQSDKVIFGSMFLQQYVNWWSYDYSGSDVAQTLSMQLSSQTTLTGSYIGNGVFAQAESPFIDIIPVSQKVPLQVDPLQMLITANASIGFLGDAMFGVSPFSSTLQTWSDACMQVESDQLHSSCSQFPANVETYFNSSLFNPELARNASFEFDGFSTSGKFYNTSLCVSSPIAHDGVDFFCTVDSFNEVYVADQIYESAWNRYIQGTAGTIGLGYNSPIWQVQNATKISRLFDVYMSNFNDYARWGPLASSFSAGKNSGEMNFGVFSPDYAAQQSLTVNTTEAEGFQLKLSEFSFGLIFPPTELNPEETKSVKSLLNSNPTVYNASANRTSLNPNMRGIGLPTPLYREFSNLLSIASKGQSSCSGEVGGICTLPYSCDYFNKFGIWEYEFLIGFEGASDFYFRIPLANFATIVKGQRGGVCGIMVQNLDIESIDSNQIVFGSMFFQAVYVQYTVEETTTSLKMFRNLKAIPGTKLSDYMPADTNQSAFTVPIFKPVTDKKVQKNAQPTFQMNIAGVNNPDAYYMMDFTADRTVLWNEDCRRTVGEKGQETGTCDKMPTLMQLGFSAANNDTGVIQALGDFSDEQFGGYVISGTKYTTELCLPDGTCKIGIIYSGETVTADNWRYNKDGTYGMIGMGPRSFFWNGFADIESKTVTYSMVLARVPDFKSVHTHALTQAAEVQSNITFGSAGDQDYLGNENVVIHANADFKYDLDSFKFGIVYQENGVDSSQYFTKLDSRYPVEFTTNFMGLGLPSDLYLQVVALLEQVTSTEIMCDMTTDGICVLHTKCEDYESFVDYTFLFDFTSSTGNFIRVPLATFATTVNNKCNIEITYLDSLATQSNNIILGGMFFQEFFGVFNNVYDANGDVQQNAQLYVSQNSIYNSYVGDQTLPQGENPFGPNQPDNPPTSDNVTWIVVLSVLAVVLIGCIAFGGYKWKVAKGRRQTAGVDTEKHNFSQPLHSSASDEI